jgi:hypothetical protein
MLSQAQRTTILELNAKQVSKREKQRSVGMICHQLGDPLIENESH